jgi:hypothetical protein
MKKTAAFVLLITLYSMPAAYAQTLLPATFSDNTNPTFLSFYLPAKDLREKIAITEELTDLVKCFSVDSILKKRTQRHRVIGSRIINVLGWNWRSVNMKKIKVVGTVRKIGGVADKSHFKELDVNYDLIPHTQKYIDIHWSAYEAQMKTKKAQRQRDFTKPPFIYPTPETIDNYRLHCECTPYFKDDYREQINTHLYPVYSGNSLLAHKNFMHEHPTMGMYGALVLDCNHSCHPEIHPYEWLFWLDLSPEKDNVLDKISWVFGYLRDVSQRQRNWVKKSRSGVISFPFIFKTDNKNKEIYIEHNIIDEWRPEEFKSIKGIPDEAINLDFETFVYDIGKPGNSITVRTNKKLPDAAAKLWLTELNVDEKNGYVTGYINLALSMKNIYTGRVTMSKLQLSIPNPK